MSGRRRAGRSGAVQEIVGVYLRRFCGVFIFFKLSTYDMAGSVLLSTVQSRSK